MSRIAFSLLMLLPTTVPAADAVRVDREGDPLPAGALVRYGSPRLRHPGGAAQLAFSRDGTRLVSVGGEPACAIVWDVATGKAIARLEAKGLTGAAFAPNGTVVLAANEPVCVHWDPINNRTRPLLAQLKVKDETRAGRAIAVSPDGRAVALGCDKGLLIWLDAASGRELGRLERRDQPDIQSLAYSNDGKTLIVRAGGCDAFLVDAQRYRAVRSYALVKEYAPEVLAAALSADGARFAVSIRDRREGTARTRVLETAFDDEPAGFTPPPVCPLALQFSADGAAVIGVTDDGILLRWNVTTGHEVLRVATNEAITVATFDSAARLIATAESGGFIRIYDTASGKSVSPPRPVRALVSASFIDGRRVATHDLGGGIRLWDRDTGEHRQHFTVPDGCLSPDGRTLAGWDAERTLFRVTDAASGKERWRSPPIDNGGRMSFSPDSRLLAVGRNRTAALELWDVETGRRRAVLTPSTDCDFSTLYPVWSPDGHHIMAFDKLREVRDIQICCLGDSRRQTIYEVEAILRVWEVTTGQLRWEKKTTAGEEPARPAWAGPGLNATFVQHRIVRTFRVGRDEPMWEELAASDATAIGVSSDGRWLALGFRDGAVHVREPGKPTRHVATGHTGGVTSLTFSADSSRLLSGSTDGTAILWELAALPPPASTLSTAPRLDAERTWKALAEPKGAELVAALDVLTGRPDDAVRLLGERLRPVPAADTKHLQKLIADLGDGKYDVREKAHRELVALGEQAEPALVAALRSPANAEQKRRLESLTTTLDGPTTDPAMLRQIRAVELLEQLATPAARELLTRLAAGDANARLSKDSLAALRRLKRD